MLCFPPPTQKQAMLGEGLVVQVPLGGGGRGQGYNNRVWRVGDESASRWRPAASGSYAAGEWLRSGALDPIQEA